MKLPAYIDRPFEQWRASFSFYDEVSVRFSETDMFGHMNNVTPFVYFEEARISYFKKLHMMNENRETMTVVASQQCDYLRQVMPYEALRIFVKTSAVGNASLTLHYIGENQEGEPCFTGTVVMVQISKKSGKAVSWTEDEKANLLA
ncbi:acyl-CoA thioesterase [Bacillus atrophaeus]|uniref:acyl-CoA thioesterase n=1 Tax=Bacillus atrophaeus TaxID=1452 RepID=UPI00227E2B9A|nr:thioesterase family protein [Bacillus atrophaeus]MCY8838963.1 acyl-CoA thioesterase [Bacillus atrophaeus]MEC5220898.1 thioesterase family protein [Bacillus atrophaeus]MED4577976.1 thioesterase family protein [Bacillus atrophaeus]MED4721586.1 thioesterase family protein [Bacillus atrophaeus]MED4849245.1 thioesterase family protein [Bacillus atrophaeus]